jgi:hypothetical protein
MQRHTVVVAGVLLLAFAALGSLVLLYGDGRKVRANFHLADQATRDTVTAFVVSTRRFVRVK